MGWTVQETRVVGDIAASEHTFTTDAATVSDLFEAMKAAIDVAKEKTADFKLVRSLECRASFEDGFPVTIKVRKYDATAGGSAFVHWGPDGPPKVPETFVPPMTDAFRSAVLGDLPPRKPSLWRRLLGMA